MKKINQTPLLFIGVALVVSVILYFKGSTILLTLANTNWVLLIPLIILNIPYIALGGYAFDILCRPYHIVLRFQDWFGLSFIANLMNQLLPYRPGMGIRYWYLHQHYKMTFSQFTFIMICYFLFTLSAGLLFTATGWFIKGLPLIFYNMLNLSFWLTILFVLLIVLLKIFPFHYFTYSPLKRLLKKISLACSLLIKSPRILLASLFCLIIMHLNCAVLLFYAFTALNSPIPLLHCLFLAGLLSITMIFPITPGNIGVLETLMGTLTQLMYNNFTLGFSATALFRASQWAISLTLGIFFSVKLISK